jgi:hypothetical protein
MSAVPEFFDQFPIRAVSSGALDEVLQAGDEPRLTILFLWGYQCPNCDIAKRALLLHRAELAWPQVQWLHCNVYDDAPMATRFSLHGVPVFLVFQGARPAGRMTGWPGIGPFTAAIDKQLAPIRTRETP